MNDLETRLAALQLRLEQQQRKLRRTLRVAVIVYAIIIVVVLIYTTLVYQSIAEMTSRQALIDQINSALNQLPEYRQKLVAQYDENADAWAKATVGALIEYIPQLETPIKDLINEQTEQLAQVVEKDLVPAFVGEFKEQAPELKKKDEDLKAEDAMKGVVGIFMDVVTQELDKYIDDQFVADINGLELRLRKLAKPEAPLTRAEDAQRRVLQAWWELNRRGPERGESMFAELLDEAAEEYSWLKFLKTDVIPQVKAALDETDIELVDPAVHGAHEPEE